MTESDLYGSSFDYDGNSPCVFFRPMNPALSVHNRFPDDSPLYIYEKDNWSKRGGVAWTPASPLMGSTSYMSQESSYCSLLNNAVILEDDDVETIPSDEKPQPLVSLRLQEANSSLQDDVSPIVLNNHRQSGKSVDVRSEQPAFTSGTNESNSGVIDSFPNTFSTDGRDSSLQEFLNIPQKCEGNFPVQNRDDGIINMAPAAADFQYPVSSPGPQWSPGIRNGSAIVNLSSSALCTPEESQGLIHVEATLNYLDGMPSTSPSSRRRRENDSLMSISAIPMTRNDEVTNLLEDEDGQTSTTNVVLENSTQLMSETVLIDPFEDQPGVTVPATAAATAASVQIMGHEPSPVKRFTHRRTLSILGSSAASSSSVFPPGLPTHSIPSPPRRIQRSPSPRPSVSILGPLSVRSGLSSIEREVREAQEGRRKLLDQIRQNRKNFESLKTSTTTSTINGLFAKSSFFSPGGPLPAPPPTSSRFVERPRTTASTMSSVTRSARLVRGRSVAPSSSSFFLDKTTTISPGITFVAPRKPTNAAAVSSSVVTHVSVPKLNVSTTSRSRSVMSSRTAVRGSNTGATARSSSSSQRPPWRF